MGTDRMLIEVDGLAQGLVPSHLSLGEVMGGLRTSALSRRKVLSGILLDGVPLTSEREESFAARPASEFQRLSAELKDVSDAVAEVLLGLEGALDGIAVTAAEAAGRLRVGEAGAPLIGRVIADLQFVVQAYQSARGLMEASGAPPAGAGMDADARLSEVLREILAGLAAGDMVTLGDALEHQFGPALGALHAEIRAQRAALPRSIGSDERGAAH
jgi:hypothetical protein